SSVGVISGGRLFRVTATLRLDYYDCSSYYNRSNRLSRDFAHTAQCPLVKSRAVGTLRRMSMDSLPTPEPTSGQPTAPGARRRLGLELGVYAMLALVCMVASVVVLELAHVNLRVPFDYHGDEFPYDLQIKSIADNGWALRNPLIGAPAGFEPYDFPNADG